MFLVNLEAYKPVLKTRSMWTYHFEEVFYAHGSCHLFAFSLGFSFALDVIFPILRIHVVDVFVGTGVVVLSMLCYLSSSFPFVASCMAARS
jgi:hypothetical protein